MKKVDSVKGSLEKYIGKLQKLSEHISADGGDKLTDSERRDIRTAIAHGWLQDVIGELTTFFIIGDGGGVSQACIEIDDMFTDLM